MSSLQFRQATEEDARHIAELIAISSDGVAVIEWQAEADKREDCSALDIGAQTYQQSAGNYSYNSCIVAELDHQVAGMLLTFPVPKDSPARSDRIRPSAQDPNVFAPYIYLEEPDSWYVCGVALYPAYRGNGIGTQLMRIAEQQARERGYSRLSLVAFEQNSGSVNLYKRLGYEVVDQAAVIPHPLIPYTGHALLMLKRL